MTVEKTKTKAITLTNHNRNKQLHEPITIPTKQLRVTRPKRGKNHAYIVRLVLRLIGRETGASLLSQSLSVAIAITQLLSTVIWKLL